MSDITEKDVMEYCYSRNLMLVTKESVEHMHRPIVIETMNKNAIPIEWIKEWQNRHEWEYQAFFRMKEGVPKYAIECMIEDWEKENANK